MTIKRKYFSYLALTSLSLLLLAGACTNKSTQTITGRIFITGNEPFTELALETPSNEVYKLNADEELKSELWQQQGKVVEIQCKDIQQFERFNIATAVKYKIAQEQFFEYTN
jgi:hypothetical protein